MDPGRFLVTRRRVERVGCTAFCVPACCFPKTGNEKRLIIRREDFDVAQEILDASVFVVAGQDDNTATLPQGLSNGLHIFNDFCFFLSPSIRASGALTKDRTYLLGLYGHCCEVALSRGKKGGENENPTRGDVMRL